MLKKTLIALTVVGTLALAPAVTAGIDPVGLVYAPRDCTTPKIEPRSITLTCADAGAVLKHLTWSDWGAEQVKGEGQLYLKDCDPNCVSGGVAKYDVKVKVLNIQTYTCAGQTLNMYRRVHIRFKGDAPPHQNSLRSFKLFCNE
jgi:hypothetical protein